MANSVEEKLEDLEVEDSTIDENEKIDKSSSEIIKFYEGSTIFLTGGTGFLGKLIIEKLLRTCTTISKIYLLVRPKKGLNAQARFDKMFNDELFEKMRIENPNYHEKVSLIMGDCQEPDLGLSEEDRQILIDNVDIVFHVAATVKFNEAIRKAAYINIRGTRDILKLSRHMEKLRAFIHISTAYSNCILPEIDEVFYKNTDMTENKLLKLIDILDDEKLEALTPSLIGKWPNTYTYTKAIAENVVREYGKNLPVAIFRPSVVISTYKEPLEGWTNNLYGPVGMAIGCAVGVMRVFRCIPEYNLDIVPADYCINASIALAWLIGKNNNKTALYSSNNSKEISNVAFDELKMEDNIPILNYVGSVQKPLTNRQFRILCNLHGPHVPSLKCIWYYCSWMKPNKYRYYVLVLLLHYIPAFFADIGLVITGRQPMMLKAYKKINKFVDANSYFNLREWIFHNRNTQAMWRKLNPTDKHLFEFDMSLLSWQKFAKGFATGARVYLLKDPIDTIPQAERRFTRLKIFHYIVISLYYLLLMSIIWKLDCSPLTLCILVGIYKFVMW